MKCTVLPWQFVVEKGASSVFSSYAAPAATFHNLGIRIVHGSLVIFLSLTI